MFVVCDPPLRRATDKERCCLFRLTNFGSVLKRNSRWIISCKERKHPSSTPVAETLIRNVVHGHIGRLSSIYQWCWYLQTMKNACLQSADSKKQINQVFNSAEHENNPQNNHYLSVQAKQLAHCSGWSFGH